MGGGGGRWGLTPAAELVLAVAIPASGAGGLATSSIVRFKTRGTLVSSRSFSSAVAPVDLLSTALRLARLCSVLAVSCVLCLVRWIMVVGVTMCRDVCAKAWDVLARSAAAGGRVHGGRKCLGFVRSSPDPTTA